MTEHDPDLAVVRTAVETFEVGRTDIEEYFNRFWRPDGVVEPVDSFPAPGRYEGLTGFKQWIEDSYGPYEDVRRRVDSITKEGDRVVVLLTIAGHSKEDDVELEVQVGTSYEVEDGRISRMCIYVGHEHALAAARAARQ